MAIKAKQIFFSILCYFVHAFIYLSIYLSPELPELNFCMYCEQTKTIFILEYTRKIGKNSDFSSSLKYGFYIVCELISWHANRIVNTREFK